MASPVLKSPLAPERIAKLSAVDGVVLATARTGEKYTGRPDVLLALFGAGTSVAGVFTRSKTASAPVDWCRAALAGGSARALIVNAGNANAFTGQAGIEAVARIAAIAARIADCSEREVFLASTGVIGETLDPGRIIRMLGGMAATASPDNWAEAAQAICTTDTYVKLATALAEIDGAAVRINGIAKGSGMIAPDMATMLAFLFSDAALPGDLLQAMLAHSVERSFNCITVDSDTSTSDTVLAFATGRISGRREFSGIDDPRLSSFRAALDTVTLDLAHQIVRDGEGAQKFIRIEVTGAENDAAARRIAFSIANSPLVKTAIAGEDANWGRIVMAVGKAGEAAERDALSIWIGGVRVAHEGVADPDYRESRVAEHLAGREIEIRVDVGVASGCAVVWTCDLTHGYISINADYRS